MRSSQPLTGPGGRRCKEDEALINSVLGPGKRGYIVDSRSASLAQSAKVIGSVTRLSSFALFHPINAIYSKATSLSFAFQCCTLVANNIKTHIYNISNYFKIIIVLNKIQ